mmetsp:Transcript_671/g.2561  ORF Transcript_671/g.2561 Transcript_671/m.2561 type:complete len:216 (+) Transcript_671:124-771(+)
MLRALPRRTRVGQPSIHRTPQARSLTSSWISSSSPASPSRARGFLHFSRETTRASLCHLTRSRRRAARCLTRSPPGKSQPPERSGPPEPLQPGGRLRRRETCLLPRPPDTPRRSLNLMVRARSVDRARSAFPPTNCPRASPAPRRRRSRRRSVSSVPARDPASSVSRGCWRRIRPSQARRTEKTRAPQRTGPPLSTPSRRVLVARTRRARPGDAR